MWGWPFFRTRFWTRVYVIGVAGIAALTFFTRLEWLFLIAPWMLFTWSEDHRARRKRRRP